MLPCSMGTGECRLHCNHKAPLHASVCTCSVYITCELVCILDTLGAPMQRRTRPTPHGLALLARERAPLALARRSPAGTSTCRRGRT